MVKSVAQIDKYARNAQTWKIHATFTYSAAQVLFNHVNALALCFSGAVLGHLALEQYLKSALIHAGMTVFDPRKVAQLDASQSLTKSDCVWGHDLVELGECLSAKQPTFELATVVLDYWLPYGTPITVRRGLEIFDSFFTEMRYSGQLNKCEGIGPDDGVILNVLVKTILPYTPPSSAESGAASYSHP